MQIRASTSCDVCKKSTSNTHYSRLGSGIWYCPECDEAERKTEAWKKGYDAGKFDEQQIKRQEASNSNLAFGLVGVAIGLFCSVVAIVILVVTC